MKQVILGTLLLCGIAVCTVRLDAGEGNKADENRKPFPPLLLHVVHIKAGESKLVEVKSATNELRPRTRDLMYVVALKKGGDDLRDAKLVNGWTKVAEGLDANWNAEGIQLRASPDTKAMSLDLGFVFSPFAAPQVTQYIGLSVIVDGK